MKCIVSIIPNSWYFTEVLSYAMKIFYSVRKIRNFWDAYSIWLSFSMIGLMRDDTIHENDDVKEAIRRLPENLYNDRVFRIKRALDLTMRQQILPKEQWTKYEEVEQLLCVWQCLSLRIDIRNGETHSFMFSFRVLKVMLNKYPYDNLVRLIEQMLALF